VGSVSKSKKTGTTPAAPRHGIRPGAKLLIALIGLLLIQVPLPLDGLLAAVATVVANPIGLGICAAVTAAYLFITRGTRR
jgi:hypothetical protein